ncbi:TetR/AcrR family transcriptional regulator [Actinomycetospora soli]|uniref:TetR/AcrR family transcriptional regulator n=1 Tax=Actinomycetospora soli TaxID=2893887 RepID=UPI001E3B4984|nr:TetR/AcrR family transcriptional regulator [Actinomycetospora soli]MCD2186536.1 TetR/AcrR family transcriptional regulator; helix-turn-helix transcriptional regulator [Actinomycetospora soli]
MPRADAARNRARLLEAAAAAFLAGGDPTLEWIARDAGVGIGTLYRHFPTREALVEAVYRAELERLCRDVDPGPHAATAFRAWLDRYAEFVLTKRGMADTFRAMVADGSLAPLRTREHVGAAVDTFLTAGAADGSLRPGVAADDVVTLLVGVVVTLQDADDRARTGRLLDLVCSALVSTNGRYSDL